ncbi:UNVERIFIED_CONTAM: hypothetical protein Sangu_0395900 [Sesamum angustifolium]|uniref:Uncharacterized protein n=1 Tax=Sesamum angustifolium TaxID=2727405 RepID=A0AAW2QTJ7_9LAMI
MAADFFWSGGARAKIHWLARDKLCQGIKEGDLGFRRSEETNLALLEKQAWWVAINHIGSLHEVLG